MVGIKWYSWQTDPDQKAADKRYLLDLSSQTSQAEATWRAKRSRLPGLRCAVQPHHQPVGDIPRDAFYKMSQWGQIISRLDWNWSSSS